MLVDVGQEEVEIYTGFIFPWDDAVSHRTCLSCKDVVVTGMTDGNRSRYTNNSDHCICGLTTWPEVSTIYKA